MYDHNIPKCTIQHLQQVLAEIGSEPTDPQLVKMKSDIEADLKLRERLTSEQIRERVLRSN